MAARGIPPARIRRKVRIAIAQAAIAIMSAVLAHSAGATGSSWNVDQLRPGEQLVYSEARIASPEPGRSIAVYRRRVGSGLEIEAASRQSGTPGYTPQRLDGQGFYPRVEASFRGGAVAAWIAPSGALRIATTDETGSFGETLTYEGVSEADYSSGQPRIAIAESGAAAIMYLAPVGRLQQLAVVTRTPGGTFADPEPIGEPQPGYLVTAGSDLDVGEDGTVVAGFRYQGDNAVAVRSPDGSWGPVQLLGPMHRHFGSSARVGVDAEGNAAVAWIEPSSGGPAPINVAFAPAGEPFGTTVESGVTATEHERIELEVSDLGEVVVVADATFQYPDEAARRAGIHAFYGSTRDQSIGHPAALTRISGSIPQLGFNGRGDAVVVWEECCPLALRARRRSPFGSFESAVDVVPPISLDDGQFEDGRGGRWALDASVDEFGNAYAVWTDTEPSPQELYAGEESPVSLAAPPPVEEPQEDLVPVLPGGVAGPYVPGSYVPPGWVTRDEDPPRLRARLDGTRRAIFLRLRANERAQLWLGASVRRGPHLRSRRAVLVERRENRMTLVPKSGRKRALVRAMRRGARLRVRFRIADEAGNLAHFVRRYELTERR